MSLLCLGLTTYFVHHAISGKHGLEVRSRLMERSRVLERDSRALEAVRARLARDVAALSPTDPDLDLIDELARDTLGVAHPNERVVLLPAHRARQ